MHIAALTLMLITAVACGATAAQTPAQTVAPTWSEVTGEQSNKGSKVRVAAVIRQVDGRFAHEPRVRIQPGERDLVVQSPPHRGFSSTDRHFRLNAVPCRRYYVNVEFRAATGTDWLPVVAKSEPIVGCRMLPMP